MDVPVAGLFPLDWNRIDSRARGALTAILTGAVVGLVALAALLVAGPATAPPYVHLTALVAPLLFAYGAHLAAPLPSLAPRADDPHEAGVLQARTRAWRRTKTVVLALHAHLVLISTGIILVPLLHGFQAPLGAGDARGWILFALMAYLLAVLVVLDALVRPSDLQRTRRQTRVSLLSLGSAAVMAAWGAGALAAGQPVNGLFAPAVVAAVAAGASAILRVPNVRGLWRAEHRWFRGRTSPTRLHSVGLPTAVGAGLALLTSLGALLLHARTEGLRSLLIQPLPRVTLILMALGLVLCTVVMELARRRRDRLPVYRSEGARERDMARVALIASVAGALVFLAAAVQLAAGLDLPAFPARPGVWVDAVALMLLAAAGPYGLWRLMQARRVRRIEERFPDFLRDLASARKAGLTLEAAVMLAGKGDYGALTPEVRRMADQLSWNVTFEEALALFSARVRTPLVERAVSLIHEASRSGGHVAHVLQAAADDAQELKEINDERRSSMRVYAGIIHIGFLVFLGVMAVMYASLVPQLVATGQAFAASGTQGAIGALRVSTGVTILDYRTFYYLVALAQAVGGGFFAGLMGGGRLVAGLPHVFGMTAAAWLVFSVLG